MKKINLNDNLLDIVTLYPEVKDIMFELGFKAIAQPGMLQTAGRYMTIKKGAKMKKIALDQIIQMLEEHGFIVEGEN